MEEITPRCVLELLGLPLGDEYHVKRLDGLRGVRNILWSVGGGGASVIARGFTREEFMNEAFLRMTAAEKVENSDSFLTIDVCLTIFSGSNSLPLSL